MSKDLSLLNAVIISYRELIDVRYQYEKLAKSYDLPSSFDKQQVERFRSFFLDSLYPHPDKRAELNEAFDSLDTYIKQPNKLFQLLLDSTKLLFKFGRHLPGILSAGLKALKSFRTASAFEQKMVLSAEKIGIDAPFSKDQMMKILKALPQQDVFDYLDNNEEMFEIMKDQKLVKKIISIMDFLIEKMQSKPNVYSKAEVTGLQSGRSIVAECNNLFSSLPKEEQNEVFALATEIERDFYEGVFG